MHAAAGGFYAVAVFLVKAGANFEKMTPKGEMAVTFARRNGHDAITRFLDEEYRKKHKNDKNDVSADMLLRFLEKIESTLLHSMIETGTLEEVRDVATPESVNSTHPSDGSTPLHVAAKCGRSDIAQLLVETGARVDEVDPSGRTALQFACEHGDSATVRYLVTSVAANVRIADKSGKTALHYACTQGGYSCVRILLTSGADSDVVDEDGLSPIDMAVSSGDLDIVRELNRQGASLNHVSKDGETILHRAIRSKKVELIEFLINQTSASPSPTNAGGRRSTSLRVGAWWRRANCCWSVAPA
jgi:ankyrin repeat protein